MLDIDLYDYNREAFEKVRKAFLTSDRVCVENATGTGKSNIALSLIAEHDMDNVLFLTSTKYLRGKFTEDLKKYGLFDHVSCNIYPSFKGFDAKGYKWCIVDEYQALGAPSYRKQYNNVLLNNPGIKVLGLTATPRRSDGKDMSAELFGGNCVYRLDMKTAIKRGILPKPDYYACYYENDDLRAVIDKNEERYKYFSKRMFYKKAKEALDRSTGLREVFHSTIGNHIGKYMVFCNSNAHMFKMMAKCREWFDWCNDYKIFFQTSKNPNKGNNYEAFISDDSGKLCLFFSVNMFNEGAHTSLKGLIFMRATASFRIFTQQYGRLMRAFDIRKLLIIDVVGNFRNLHYFGELYDENNDKRTVDKPELEGSFKVGFADFEVSNILAEIEAYHNQHLAWDKCFIIAKAFYIEHGHLVVPKDYRVGGFSLYQWVNEQRKYRYCHSRRRLEEWQIKLLDEIGMDWDPANGTWLEEYEVVKEYALENDIANISSNNSPNYGLNIPKWIKKQKADFRNGLLSERQIKLLSDIGIELEQECLSDWKSNFSKLEAYVLEHGGIDNLNKDFPLLYRWLRRQIAIACGEEKGRISEKQIRKIEDLGISIYTKRSILERQLEDLRSFTVRYKRLPTEKEKDYYQIRLALEKKLSDGKLSQIQENILINMGMKKKQKKKRKNFSWKEKCDAFESFISEFPHKQISRGTIWNDIPLGEILHHMKKKKQNGELSEAELELLERIQR